MELEELDGKHEAELQAFEKEAGGPAKEAKEPKVVQASKEPKEEAPAVDVGELRERHWAGLSKKELEEECIMRSLGKKGSKEDLIQKLIIFHQDLKSSGAAASTSAGPSKAAAKADSD